MRFLVSADETGAVKEILCNRGTDTSKKDGKKPVSIKNLTGPKEFGLKSRVVHMKSYKNEYLISARLDGTLRVNELNGDEEEPFKLINTYTFATGAQTKPVKPVSLSVFEDLQIVVVAYENGKIFTVFLSENFDVEPVEISLDENIEDFSSNPHEPGVFAYGGKEVDVKIVRLFDGSKITKKNFNSGVSKEVLFSAENVPNDHLDMKVPVWITKVIFQKSATDYKFITATRYGQIRTYSTEQTRPTGDYKLTEKPIVTLNFANEAQDEIIITDTHNYVGKHSLTKIDPKGYKIHSASAGVLLRPTLRLMGKFSEGGNTGAIFGVDFAYSENLVALGGLDRYLRVFDTNKRSVVLKVYLGTQVSSLVIVDTEEELEVTNETEAPQIQKKKRRIATEDTEEDIEALWGELDKQAKKSKKKSKK